jgi:hypothetical protein
MKATHTIHKFAILILIFFSVSPNADDLLADDDFTFNSAAIEMNKGHWTDGIKMALEHSHTQILGETSREQSSLGIVYEGNIADGWYLNIDTRYRYFWNEDDLAENRNGSYGKNKWQRAWLQYSRGACSATVGRQTLIWGTIEGTFVTDIVTPFDYTEQLLTDYGSVRLAQGMLVGECFSTNSQLQAFYIPNSRTDIYQHHPLFIETVPGLAPANFDIDPKNEWGVRYKWLGNGYDVSILYAKLFDNTPTPMLNRDPNSAISPLDIVNGTLNNERPIPEGVKVEPALAHFDLVGLSSAMAVGRVLYKLELAYRSEQLISFSDTTTERFDAAVGFEYTTNSNHIINAGLWGIHLKSREATRNNTQILRVGWRKPFLRDNLVMSLLGNWVSAPRLSTLTLLGDYQWNDYWSLLFAVTAADLSEVGQNNPIVAAEESATLSIKYEF